MQRCVQVRLLDAVDNGSPFAGHRFAQRVDAVMGRGQPRRQVEVVHVAGARLQRHPGVPVAIAPASAVGAYHGGARRPSGDAHGQLGAGDDVALGADLDPPVAADKASGRDRQRPVPRPGERGCGDGA